MEPYQSVLSHLEKMGIQYTLIEHPPVYTVEEADRTIEGIEGARTKSLFLCNRKNTAHYLLVMEGGKRLDIKKLESLISEKGLHFCSPERLMGKMLLTPGSVSLFGLLNNQEKDIKVLFDSEILEGRLISFHPNDNTKTIFISMADMYRFLDGQGFAYTLLNL